MPVDGSGYIVRQKFFLVNTCRIFRAANIPLIIKFPVDLLFAFGI